MVFAPLLAALSLTVTPVDVSLTFSPHPRLPPSAQRAALAEAAAIWAPYRVSIVAGRRTPAALSLIVVVSCTRESPAWQGPLGSVDFDADGVPGHVVTLFLDRLLRMLGESSLSDRRAENWPRAMREETLARAVGRILAHEIGHVVLRTTDHAGRGLMRAVQYARDLIEPGREQHRLEP